MSHTSHGVLTIVAAGLLVLFLGGRRLGAEQTTAPLTFAQTLAKHLAAIDARDWPAFAATLTHQDRLTLILPSGRYSEDLADYKKQMKAWLADPAWSWKTTLLHTRQGKDWGLALLKVHYQEKDEQGKIHSLDYLLNLVFQQEDGEWRLIHDQNTRIVGDSLPENQADRT